MNWKMEIDLYTLLCIKQRTNENLLQSNENYSMLCGDLNGKKIQPRGDIHIWKTDSLCWTIKINRTTPIQINLKIFLSIIKSNENICKNFDLIQTTSMLFKEGIRIGFAIFLPSSPVSPPPSFPSSFFFFLRETHFYKRLKNM